MTDLCVPVPCLDPMMNPDNDLCPDGALCDPTTGVCIPGPGSTCSKANNFDCGMGAYACAGGYCLNCGSPSDTCLRCNVDADCGPASVPYCNTALGACLGCLEDSHCNVAGGEVCHPYGNCDTPCPGNCPGYAACDQFLRCVPDTYGAECRNAGDCPGGMDCVGGFCFDCGGGSCTECNAGDSSNQCAIGESCDYNAFVCVQCRDNNDCGGATPVCNFGVCEAPCNGDADCAGAATCDVVSQTCQITSPPCTDNNECVGFGIGDAFCDIPSGQCTYP